MSGNFKLSIENPSSDMIRDYMAIIFDNKQLFF